MMTGSHEDEYAELARCVGGLCGYTAELCGKLRCISRVEGRRRKEHANLSPRDKELYDFARVETRKDIAQSISSFWSQWESARFALVNVSDEQEAEITKLAGQGWRQRALLALNRLTEWHYWTRPADVPNASLPDVEPLLAKLERGEVPDWMEPLHDLSWLADIYTQIRALRIGMTGPAGGEPGLASTLAATLTAVQLGAPDLADEIKLAHDKTRPVRQKLEALFKRHPRYRSWTKTALAKLCLCSRTAVANAINESEFLQGCRNRKDLT